ncbi:LOW QUALITY PROTEIN: transcription termination factor MTERF5, chloroplastic [Hevea brasiliensis]|uniref:LOW QUALITY PROTEIN: transcription termination factor MTERF5, chloroplastic n=1 Tax=Hevea brasiliensis TaxID=3981 RepID=UPI0025D7D5A3|nr:LOW QUALITY PROTEIN: transcription termination factor MTERF5, chloroplastic [Hevea brasiliensis]
MRAFPAIRSVGLTYPSRVLFIPRTQLSLPRKFFSCQAKFADSGVDGSFSSRVVPPTLVAAEKEEAKAVLTLFLKKQGLSNAVAARTIKKSDLFIDHLVSKLHSVHKSRYLVGRELTTLEIRDALIPYLESLLEDHRSVLVDFVENFPNPSIKGKPVQPLSPPNITLDSKKLKALSRVSETGPAGKLPPRTLYLIDLGMNLEQIKGITRRFPAFAYYSLEGKIKPLVEFLLDLGVPKSDLPTILVKRPQLCGISLSENLIPTMTFLENLGVDKRKWAKVIYRFPALLTYSRQKVEVTVDFLCEMGLSAESIGKILTRCPNIISYSVEDKLRPTAEYFRSLGVDVAVLLHRCPQTFGLSIESNLKPVTEFFFGRGYSIQEVGTMITRYGALYTFSLVENLIPKWEFFLTMDYSKEELVKFPQYFGYSLEERIKPRYALVKVSGVKLLLNQVLSLSYSDFDKALKKKMKRMLSEKASNDINSGEDLNKELNSDNSW